MASLGMTWALKTKLQKMGVTEKEMEGVNFESMASLNQFAERIVPKLLSRNPRAKEQIKGCTWLEGETKQNVVEAIDSL